MKYFTLEDWLQQVFLISILFIIFYGNGTWNLTSWIRIFFFFVVFQSDWKRKSAHSLSEDPVPLSLGRWWWWPFSQRCLLQLYLFAKAEVKAGSEQQSCLFRNEAFITSDEIIPLIYRQRELSLPLPLLFYSLDFVLPCCDLWPAGRYEGMHGSGGGAE